MNREIFKKTGEELQQYLQFRRRGSRVKARKGKGSYDRAQFKKEIQSDEESEENTSER